jgi:hypothetical protein
VKLINYIYILLLILRPFSIEQKKLANDLIANVQKQYEEFKQKKAAGLLYPTMMPGFMPFMPAYPYAGYPPYSNFPPFPGRPPFPSYQPLPARGPGYPMVPGYPTPEENAAGNPTESTTDSDKSKTQGSETATESTTQPSYDPNSYYGGYGYPTTAGYEGYSYSSAYNYYPGMEQTAGDKSSGVDPSSQHVNPYGYHYPAAYGDQQPYAYEMDNEQNPPQN